VVRAATWQDRPVDDREGLGLDARRGATGEDATVRDWAAPDEVPVPDSASAVERSAATTQPVTSERVHQVADELPVHGTPSPASAAGQPAGGDRAIGAVADEPRTGGTPAGGPVTAEPEPAPSGESPTAAATSVDLPGPGSPSDATAGPAAAVAGSSAEVERPPVTRATGAARRPPLLVQGIAPAVLAAALLAAASWGIVPLTIAVLLLQVFLSLGLLALLDAPAASGAFVVTLGTLVVANAVALDGDGRIFRLAGVAALGLIASLVHQLVRKERSRVTESLADTLVVIVVGCAAACLLALAQLDGGREVLLLGLAATGAVLLAGRVGDRFAPHPVLAQGSTRGWPGLLLGLVAGVVGALLVARLDVVDQGLPLPSAALLGVVVASTVATADLAVDLGAAELRAGWRDARRVAALRPAALLLPYALLGPVVLLAGRLVLP